MRRICWVRTASANSACASSRNLTSRPGVQACHFLRPPARLDTLKSRKKAIDRFALQVFDFGDPDALVVMIAERKYDCVRDDRRGTPASHHKLQALKSATLPMSARLNTNASLIGGLPANCVILDQPPLRLADIGVLHRVLGLLQRPKLYCPTKADRNQYLARA